jgi:hypothetical protein
MEQAEEVGRIIGGLRASVERQKQQDKEKQQSRQNNERTDS